MRDPTVFRSQEKTLPATGRGCGLAALRYPAPTRGSRTALGCSRHPGSRDCASPRSLGPPPGQPSWGDFASVGRSRHGLASGCDGGPGTYSPSTRLRASDIARGSPLGPCISRRSRGRKRPGTTSTRQALWENDGGSTVKPPKPQRPLNPDCRQGDTHRTHGQAQRNRLQYPAALKEIDRSVYL